jgi:hypothetical protein
VHPLISFRGETRLIKGHCECGSVTYEVDAEINDYSHCHCSQCRRMHGAAFASFGGVPKKNFKYLSGQDDLTRYASSSDHERIFCKVCGSNIMVVLGGDADNVYLSMGAVDGNPKLPPAYHIYVGSKAEWFDPDDKAPRYDTEP